MSDRDLEKAFFKDVFIFSLAEPYAMGVGGFIEFINEKGEFKRFNYMNGDVEYEDIKEAFPALKGCKWNGPIPGEKTWGEEYVLYVSGTQPDLVTRVNDGWHHMYLGFGNHLVVREDKWDEFEKLISACKDPIDIYGDWQDYAIKMCERNR